MVLDRSAPTMQLYVEKDLVKRDLLLKVQSVSWEEIIDTTSEMKIVLADDDGSLVDNIMFGPGNEISLYAGYANENAYIGHAEIISAQPHFAPAAMPTIELTLWDRGWRLKKQQLAITNAFKAPRKLKGHTEPGTVYKGNVALILEKIAKKYRMIPSIARRFYTLQDSWVQKKGQNDFEMVKALANFYSGTFSVEWWPPSVYSVTAIKEGGIVPRVSPFYAPAPPLPWGGRALVVPDGRKDARTGWHLVFRDLLTPSWPQVNKYIFSYESGQESLIESIDFKFDIAPLTTEIQAFYWDPESKGPDGKYGGWRMISKSAVGTGKAEDDPFHHVGRSQHAEVSDAPHPATFRLVVAGHSIEVLTHPFKDAATARSYVAAWYKRNHEHFITAEFSIPGWSDIRIGETHTLASPLFGKRYSGDYWVSSVKHKISAGSTWDTYIEAHKVFA